MKQPKFKFGDKVREGGQSPFVIEAISFNRDSGSYTYTDKCFKPWHKEERLELVQEPQKKKLYAYSDTIEEVRFFTFDLPSPIEYDLKKRTEYDIEYPGAK